MPSDITEPSQYVAYFRIFNKTNSSYGILTNETTGIIDFDNKEIRLYGSLFNSSWNNPSLEDDEFSFQMEYYYDWL